MIEPYDLGMVITLKNERLEKSLAALKEFSKELGYWPSTTEWNAHSLNQYLSGMSISRNTKKTWEEMREQFGFKPKSKKFTKEEALSSLVLASEDNKGNLTLKKYNEWRKKYPDSVTQGRIERLFGSFNNAKREAGLPVLKPYRKKYTIQEIEQALIDCSKDLGGLFSNTEYDKWTKQKGVKGIQYPSLRVVINTTDSIQETKKRLGIPTHVKYMPMDKISKEEMEKGLNEFVVEQLQQVKYRRWSIERGKPSISTLSNFGGYYKLLSDVLKKRLEDNK